MCRSEDGVRLGDADVVGKAVLGDSDGKAEGEDVGNVVGKAVGTGVAEAVSEEVFLLFWLFLLFNILLCVFLGWL